MDQLRKIRVERVVDLAITNREAMDDESAARLALRSADQSAIEELAVVALVAIMRNRDRREALAVEREAEVARPKTRAVDPSLRAAFEEADARASLKMNEDLRRIIDDYAARLKMQWTTDLLGTTFALEDGSRVTWGDATVEQHRERVAMFTSNAVANMEGAARHGAAVRDLEASGALTLRELVSVTA